MALVPREHRRRRCPIVDTWWQTETGEILITPLPGRHDDEARQSATFPFPGIQADVVDAKGESVPLGQGGYLVLKRPWPAMLRGIYGDPERYKATYWSRFPGMYFAGDGAKRDSEGYYWLLGRVDDVMNVSGHRLSTTEIEIGARVASCGRRGGGRRRARPGHRRGDQRVRDPAPRQSSRSKALGEELRNHVAHKISPIAKPKSLMFVPDLPKTRSGKIMRRLLKDIATGRSLGDTTTLADANVVERHPREVGRDRRGVGGAVRLPPAEEGPGQEPTPDGGADEPGPDRVARAPPAGLREAAPGSTTGAARARRRRCGIRGSDASDGTAKSGSTGGRRRLQRPGRIRPAGGVVRFDGLTEDWRLSGTMHIEGRLSDALNRRETVAISDMHWAPIDGSGPMVPAPGLKSIDPYDLIAVLAGPDTLPEYTEEERIARRVRKEPYQVVLEAPPFRIAGHRARLPRHRSTRRCWTRCRRCSCR